MKELQEVINALSKGRRFHVSVAPTSDLFSQGLTKLAFFNKIHSKEFCNCAKATVDGLNLCLKCNEQCIKKALEEKEAFLMECPYGAWQVVCPIIIDGTDKGVIYISNLAKDKAEIAEKIRKTASRTGVEAENLLSQIDEFYITEDFSDIYVFAELIRNHITILYNEEGELKRSEELHWVVESIKEHIDSYYSKPFLLKQVSGSYFYNPKYLGALFKSQIGLSVKSYLNSVRLKNAEEKLKETGLTVLEIALDSGYENVTYFNRVFMKKNGMTPSEYRKKMHSQY